MTALVLKTSLKLGKLQCETNFNIKRLFLLMIENFETIQIVMCHVSHVTFKPSQTLKPRDLKFSRNIYHTLCVMCPVSHVTCQMSLFMCHVSRVTIFSDFFYKVLELVGGGFFLASGTTPSIQNYFVYALIPRICFSWLAVVHFRSFKKQVRYT